MMNFATEYKSLLESNVTPPGGLRGDGVIMGLFERGDNAHASVLVTINILRDLLNWRGAIQLWHVGDAPKLCKNFDVEFVNAAEMVKTWPGHIRSWALKSYAIEHSGLARVMWIDWDAYCCRNPSPIFSELDSTDFYYWRNGEHWDTLVNRGVFESVTTAATPHSVQGGVYLINCASPGGWKMLHLQRLWDTHERETWGQNYDQDGWLLACTAGAGRYACNDNNPWVWPAWVSYYEGRPYFVHRCGEKLTNRKLARFNRQLPLDEIVERLYHKSLGDTYGKLLQDSSRPSKHERCEQARRERQRA